MDVQKFDSFDAVPCSFLVTEPIPKAVGVVLTEHQDSLGRALADLTAKRQITQVLFVAVGGSYCSLFTGNYIVQRQAKNLRSNLLNANDFLLKAPQTLGEDTVVVLASDSGSTKEVVAAAAYAKEKGCFLISITGKEDSPLAKAADYPAVYRVPAISMAQTLLGSLSALCLLKALEAEAAVEEILAEYQNLPELMEAAKIPGRDLARAAAAQLGGKQNLYVVGAGIGGGLAYKLAVIGLQEFSWVKAAYLDAGDFFHGPLEIAEEGLPMIMILDANEQSRALTKRVMDFADKLGADYCTFDASALSPDASEYISWFILFFALQWFTFYMGMCRDHNPDDKRYMGVISY